MSSSSNDLFSAFHSLPPISKATCRAAFQHNPTGEWLSLLIVVGLVVSYLPQHYRIIHSRNSEGFSALFLLLGATSSASSLANIVTLQWGQIACCQYLSGGQCFESVLGIAQVFVQWFCFNLIFVLYLIYYPLSSKYVRSVPIATSSLPHSHRKPQPFLSSLVPDFMRSTDREVRIRPSASSESLTSTAASDDSDDEEAFAGSRIGGTGRFDPRSFLLPGQIARGEIVTSTEFRHALYLFFLTCLHFVLTFLTTFILIITLPGAETPHAPSPPGVPAPPGGGHGKEHPQERAVRVWAATLGWVSLGLACVQYAPQLVLTARKRLVGSLSVPMMILQTPGSFLFVYTLAIRPSVTYTAWITYFVTGLLQGSLLVLCLMWKRRQASLGIDDWGRKVDLKDGGEGEAGREAEGERRRLLE